MPREEDHQIRETGFAETAKGGEKPHVLRSLLSSSAGSASECGKALIEILGRERSVQSKRDSSGECTSTTTELVLSSRLGVVLLVLIQLTLIGGTCFILFLNAVSIGYARGQNWFYALVTLAFYVASSWLAVVVISPFGKLGGDPFKYGGIGDAVSEDP